jgi:hypothetical protein
MYGMIRTDIFSVCQGDTFRVLSLNLKMSDLAKSNQGSNVCTDLFHQLHGGGRSALAELG